MQILTDTVRPPAKGDRPETGDAGKADFSFEMSLLDGPLQRPGAPFNGPGPVPMSAPSSASPTIDSEIAGIAPPPQPSDAAPDEKKPSNSSEHTRWPDTAIVHQQQTTRPDDQGVAPAVPIPVEPSGAESIALRPAPQRAVTSDSPHRSAVALPVTEHAPALLGPDLALPASRPLGALSPKQPPARPDVDAQPESSRHPPSPTNLATPVPAKASVMSPAPIAADEGQLPPAIMTCTPQMAAVTPTVQPTPQAARLPNLPDTIVQTAFLQTHILARPVSAHPPLTAQNEGRHHDGATPAPTPDASTAGSSPRNLLHEPMSTMPPRGLGTASGATAPLITAFRLETMPNDSTTPPLQAEIGQVTGAAPHSLGLNLSQPELTDRQSPPPRLSPPATQAAQGIVLAAQDKTAPITELTLSPEELGKVRFEITTQDDRLSVRLYAERPETLDLLRRQSDLLLAELKQAGYAQSSLSFGAWGQNRNAPSASHNQTSTAGIDDDQMPRPSLLPKPAPLLASGRLHIRL